MDSPKIKKTRWNQATVVAAAGDLADAEGLAAVTLTRLAEVLGIRPPSLFNHVASLADLVRLLALGALADLVGRLETAVASAPTAPEALEGLMGAYRGYVRQHPGRYAATLALPVAQLQGDAEWRALDERILVVGRGLAARFGLEGPAAIHALRGWRALAHGFSDLERQGGFGIPLDCDESFRIAVHALTPRGS